MNYFEDKKVISVEDTEDGKKRITAEIGFDFTTNQPMVESFDVTAWEYEVNSGDDTIDASSARNNRAVYVVDKIYEVMKNLDVRTEEISFTVQKLISKLQGIEQQAILNCFGKVNQNDVKISDWENKL